jgi:hypothetical protein
MSKVVRVFVDQDAAGPLRHIAGVEFVPLPSAERAAESELPRKKKTSAEPPRDSGIVEAPCLRDYPRHKVEGATQLRANVTAKCKAIVDLHAKIVDLGSDVVDVDDFELICAEMAYRRSVRAAVDRAAGTEAKRAVCDAHPFHDVRAAMLRAWGALSEYGIKANR